MHLQIIALVLGSNIFGSHAGIVLWQGKPDVVPPYFSKANVSLDVQQDGDYRDFIWTAAWLDSAISGEMNMGRMVCPMSETERSRLALLPIEERSRLHVPCNFRDPAQLTAGSEIVQQIVSSVAALNVKRVAMVGLGPGTMATYWQRYHPQIERIDVAELSATVVDVASRYFGLQPDQRLRVHVADGMEWLREAEPFDVFVHDATGSQHYFLWPSSLRLIRKKSNGGAMVINILGTPAPLKALLLSYLRLQFAEVRTFSDVVVASWTPLPTSLDGLLDHNRVWQEQDTGSAYRCYYRGIMVLLSMAVLAALISSIVAKTNQQGEMDEEELVPITKLHPRAGFHLRAGIKDCDLAALSARSKLCYGVL